MSKKDYNKVAELSLKLISKNGSDCIITRNEGALIDANKPWLGQQVTNVDYPCNGVLLSISSSDYKQYPELTTVGAQKKILVDPISLGIEPNIGDLINHKGVDWLVTSYTDLTPAETTVLWTLFVSR